MPQTTVAFPTSTISGTDGSGLTPTAWTNPNNAQADDGSNATSSAAALTGGTQYLRGAQFHVLSEEATAMRANSTGSKIPTGANILGIRLSFDLIANNGTLTNTAQVGGTNSTAVTYATNTQAIQTVGFGTLSSGSTVAGGNTFISADLSTVSGQQAARALLADGTITLVTFGGAGSGISTATYGIDFMSITIQWIVYKDATGGSRANSSISGSTQKSIIRTTIGQGVAVTQTPAFVRSQGGGSQAYAAPVALQPVAAIPVGNTLLSLVSVNAAATISISDSKGNTYNPRLIVSTSGTMALFSCCVASALATTDTITISSTGGNAILTNVMEYTNLADAAPEFTGSSSGVSSAAAGPSTGTLTGTKDLIVGIFQWGDSSTFAQESSYAATAQNSYLNVFQQSLIYKVVTGTTAQTPSGTFSGAPGWWAGTLAFRATQTGSGAASGPRSSSGGNLKSLTRSPGGSTVASSKSASGSFKTLTNSPGGSRIISSKSGGSQYTLITKPGGAIVARSVAASPQTTIISKAPAGGVISASRTGGSPKAQVSKTTTGGQITSSRSGGSPKPQTNNPGGSRIISSQTGGSPKPQTRNPGGGVVGSSKAGGVARVFSFSISGYARNFVTNATMSGVRCKVYRFSDDQLMGTTISDATGYYAIAIPGDANQGQTFWVRFWKSGTPNLFATTDDDLPLVVSQVQGPPL